MHVTIKPLAKQHTHFELVLIVVEYYQTSVTCVVIETIQKGKETV